MLEHTICWQVSGALRTKWKFVVEFEDEETNEISGTIGQADTREECEGFLEFDMQYHDSHGRIILNADAAEVCAKCESEGKIAAMNGRLVICDACGGCLGPISNLTTLRPLMFSGLAFSSPARASARASSICFL
jgi:hypothetical protein